MVDVEPLSYLDALNEEQREALVRVNRDGITLLRELVDSGAAIAFLGAGVSVPLYPTWDAVISELIDAALGQLTDEEAHTCRALSRSSPDAVVEIVRRQLGSAAYAEVLREIFRVRRDPDTGRTWTAMHELVVRCKFAGLITTNYDAGIVNARMAVRTQASATGFASWTDEAALDRWRTQDVFSSDELPVLFAHGHHNQAHAIVLATSEYRRAYGGKLAKVLGSLLDGRRVVWIGFSFADQRIAAILREIAEGSGTQIDRGQAARHVALMPWDPNPAAGANAPPDPGVLSSLSEIQFGSRAVLYPEVDGDHSALRVLLEEFTDPQHPPARSVATTMSSPVKLSSDPGSRAPMDEPAIHDVHGNEPVAHFTGRADELVSLSRWAADEEVRLIGVTAWGGAGKTSLVTEWLTRREGGRARPSIRGVFSWNFYENPSEQAWATELVEWARDAFGVSTAAGPVAAQVLEVSRAVPLIVFLDGLEVIQESPAGPQFGRFLQGPLRTVLTGWCEIPHEGLAVLTSRFPFADLEQFDGGAARMLEAPPFTSTEGADLLNRAGGGWLPEKQRHELVRAVHGHPLAVGALAGALARHLPTSDLGSLVAELELESRTDARVARVLRFYAERLSKSDRQLVALVSLFQRPVTAEVLLSLDATGPMGRCLEGWTRADVEVAVRQRLTGLLSWHADLGVSGHPLVRDAFRPLVLTGDSARQVADVTLGDLPGGKVASREDARRVVETIELLLDADEWIVADQLYNARLVESKRLMTSVLTNLMAFDLSKRCALAFVGTPARQERCRDRLSGAALASYANDVGTCAFITGDVITAERFLAVATEHHRNTKMAAALALDLQNWSWFLSALGNAERSRASAAEGLEVAAASESHLMRLHAHHAVALALSGETMLAEQEFLTADRMQFASHGHHLCSLRGTLWAEFLIQSGRLVPARLLTELNWEMSVSEGWDDNVPRCDRILGQCDLADGELADAEARLESAAETLRGADYPVELGKALVVLADQRLRSGQLDRAEQLCTEASALAAPRGFVPGHAAALAMRARVRGQRYATTHEASWLERARDDADHVLRLATRTRRLPWQELDGTEAHSVLDAAEGRDHGWAERARARRALLVPQSLEPDPLAAAEAASA